MRRKDREITDREAIMGLLREAVWGTLGLTLPGGGVKMVPLDFVVHQGCLCFHSAPAGEKLEAIQACPEASFLVVDPLSAIPSHVFSPANAGRATHYYRSVIVHGRVGLVPEPGRKAEILAALMEKYQPEGGYEPVTAASPTYAAGVAGLAVLAMTIDRCVAKGNLGQSLAPGDRARVVRFLEERGLPEDRRTLAAMAAGQS